MDNKYASYWNAFLFEVLFALFRNNCNKIDQSFTLHETLAPIDQLVETTVILNGIYNLRKLVCPVSR